MRCESRTGLSRLQLAEPQPQSREERRRPSAHSFVAALLCEYVPVPVPPLPRAPSRGPVHSVHCTLRHSAQSRRHDRTQVAESLALALASQVISFDPVVVCCVATCICVRAPPPPAAAVLY